MPYGFDSGYDTPSEDVRIWRYLTFPKFEFLLRHGLWVPSFRTLRAGDPFEGTYTSRELQHLEDLTTRGRFVQHLPSLSDSLTADRTYVSCWCEGAVENESMWKKFVGHQDDAGVAVGTTIGRLKEVLGQNESPSNIGRVRYDYSPDSDGHVEGHRLFLRKRPELAHEREVRAVLVDLRPGPLPGLTLSLCLSTFVEEIRLCPGAQRWFRELAAAAAYAAGIRSGCISRSTLDARPPPVPLRE